MARVGDVLVGFRADVGQFTAATDRVQGQLQRVGEHGTRSGAVFNKLEKALHGAAFGAAGIPGPFGRVASTLLRFSAGGAVTLAVVAGIGLMGAAWNKLTEQARTARESLQASADALFAIRGQLSGAERDVTISSAETTLERLQKKLKDRQDETKTVDGGRYDILTGKMSGKTVPKYGPDDKEIQRLLNLIGKVEASLARLKGERSKEERELLGFLTRGVADLQAGIQAVQPDLERFYKTFTDGVAVDRLAKQWRGVTEEWDHLREVGADLSTIVERLKTPVEELADDFQKVARAMEDGLIDAEFGSKVWQKLLDDFLDKQKPIKEAFANLGKETAEIFSRTFVKSAFDGFKNFGQVLKNLLETVIEEAIIAGLRKGFGKGKGDSGGGGVVSSLIGAAGTVIGAVVGGGPGAAAGGTGGKILGDALPFAAPPVPGGDGPSRSTILPPIGPIPPIATLPTPIPAAAVPSPDRSTILPPIGPIPAPIPAASVRHRFDLPQTGLEEIPNRPNLWPHLRPPTPEGTHPTIVLQGPPTAPGNPLAAARDSEWMKFLSVSIANHKAAGGRF